MRNLNTEEVLLVAGGEDAPDMENTTNDPCQWEDVDVHTETSFTRGTNAMGSYSEFKITIVTDGNACQYVNGAVDTASVTVEAIDDATQAAGDFLNDIWEQISGEASEAIQSIEEAAESMWDRMVRAWEEYQQQCRDASEGGYGAYVCFPG